LFCADSLGGLVLDHTVVNFEGIAVFQPVINGMFSSSCYAGLAAWNRLPGSLQSMISMSLILVSGTVFHLTPNLRRQIKILETRLKTFIFSRSFLSLLSLFLKCLSLSMHFGHYNRSLSFFITGSLQSMISDVT